MLSTLHRIEAFFFARRDATTWGLMRMVWAFSTFLVMLLEMPDIARLYSDSGLLPPQYIPLVTRTIYRFTIFTYVTDPTAVFLTYLIMMLSLFCMFVGLWPRISTTLSVLLLFSFHERDPITLGGGETVLRCVGFLLMISPGIGALSLERARKQRTYWEKTGKFLAPLTMPAWPKRLLLWQLLVLYLTSLWDKLLGNMWWWGTAVIVPFHHPHFARFAPETLSFFMPLLPYIDYATLALESLWFLMLIPHQYYEKIPVLRYRHVRRIVLIGGLCFHGSIFILMNVGSFFFAMMSAYTGMIEKEDLEALRRIFNKGWKGRISVLYDGACGFCTKSVFWLGMMDWLDRLRLVNFQNPVVRKKFAPDLDYKDLDRSMHIRYPAKSRDVTGTTLSGFRAFRSLTWNLPLTWPIAPFLYLPGISHLGERVYRWKADSRKKCAHGECLL